MLQRPIAILHLLLCVAVAEAVTLGPDRIPWPPEESSAKAPTRTRWLFRPNDPNLARAQLISPVASAPVDLVAELPRFAGLWILEADTGQEAAVESQWSQLGSLRRDRSGTPQLFETTRLIGAVNSWTMLDLWGDRTQSIAILDSGADTAHDDLGDRDGDNVDNPPQSAGDADDWVDAGVFGFSKDALVRIVGWHDVGDDMPGSAGPYDYHRHGTALAGVALGSGRKDVRYRGVAPEGRGVIVKTYNFEGQWQLWASDLLLGIDWVIAHRDSHRICIALIGATWPEDLEISTGIEALLEAGIAVVAPAGNDPQQPMGYPARLADVITVGATDEQGLLANYSTVDPGIEQNLDLVAPGGTYLTPNATVLACDNEPNDAYRGRVGSSIAAAHVAGVGSLVLQAMRESGRVWRRDRDQARWLRSLLRVTAVEVEGAESGALLLPVLDRVGWDRAEGAGMLQARAAVDAVRQFHWPGDLEQIFLQSPRLGDAVWAARMPVWGQEAVRVELSPPVDADFDLIVYLESESGFELRAASTQTGLGRAERVDLEQPRDGAYLIVVRRVVGAGLATLQSERILHGDTRWPLQLSSTATQAPALVDLDGDGDLEILTVNNLPIDGSAHTWFAFHSDGRNFGLFPRTYFSASDRSGEVFTPASADLGSGTVLVSGSAFGIVYGVDAQAQLRFARTVSGAARTSGVALLPAGSKRIVVGTENGLVFLDAAGTIVDDWPTASGVVADPLLIDLVGDDQEEIVFVEGNSFVHARESSGTALPGWPIALGGLAVQGSAIGYGDGSGSRWVAWVEQLPSGNSRLRAVDAAGAARPGFPVDFATPGGGVSRASAGLIATRLTATGPTALAAAAIFADPANRQHLALHRFALDGTQSRSVGEAVTEPAFVGSTFQPTRRLLSPLRSVQLGGDERLDLMFASQLAWEEFDLTQRRRYGSSDRIVQWSEDLPGALRELRTRNGHLLNPAALVIAPAIGDLDGDGFADLVIARGSRLYRQSAGARDDVDAGWTRDRVDLRRSGCYRCRVDPVVSAPERLPLSLDVHPNPFNPRTVLRWSWPTPGSVEFELFDARGRSVRRWVRAVPTAGHYEDTLEGKDRAGHELASGVYRLRMRGAAGELTRSLTLLR